MNRKVIRLFLVAVTALLVLALPASPQGLHSPQSLRLYVFDCGILHNSDAVRYRFRKEELTTLDMSVACFLIAHPKGALIWDTGAVPDDAWTPTGSPTTQHIILPDAQQRQITVVKSLKGQLAEIGYSASDIKYLVLSHYHWDHTANANQFTGAAWLCGKSNAKRCSRRKLPERLSPQPIQPYGIARQLFSTPTNMMCSEIAPSSSNWLPDTRQATRYST